MKKLLCFFRRYRKETVLAPLFKLAEVLLELIVPLVVATIIDRGIGEGLGTAYILRRCLFLLLLGALGLGFTLVAQYFSAKAASGVAAEIRKSLFRKMESLSYSAVDSLGESTMITRITGDVDQLQTGINLTLRLFLRSPFVVLGAMVMAFTVDTRSALVFAVAIPLLMLAVFGILFLTLPLYRKVRGGLDSLLLSAKENLEGVRVLRAFGQEEKEIDSFSRKNADFTRLLQKVGRISALLNPLTYLLLNIAVIFLLQRGAWQVDTGALTKGEVVALYNYMSQILVELIKFANLIITVTKAAACASRISAVLEMPSEQAEVLSESGGQEPEAMESERGENDGNDLAVEFSGASLRYHPDGDPALFPLSFSVRKGETVGILGGTGAGKTTLVNLIPGFYLPSSGSVRVFGRETKDWDLASLRKRIGIVPQKAMYFSGSIRENLLMGNPDATEEILLEAIRAAQAEDVVRSKGGLDARLAQGGRDLSGGQRQRLTIARALARRPEILILDDSGSALDYATDRRLRKAIAALPYHPTVFLISQRPAGLMTADRILLLEDGELRFMGTHSELLRESALYREIWDSQSDSADEKGRGKKGEENEQE